ncbi:MAG: type I-C CRISPR-associated protein Cas7/Csd2 [Desulfobulbaceae bacterium]|nr:type I-C CRISPR-associated protein Cas7/Csd2 [Desulfobulbaceae bacterium]
MGEPLKNRYEFVYLFEVENGNPNGDPDAGNLPRLDPETNHGLVTDVCLKRKVRNYVQLAEPETTGYEIYVREKAVLNAQNFRAYENYPDIKPISRKLPKKEEEARQITGWMCHNFFDVRTFGAVMTTEVNCGQVRGPVQFNFARSIEPVMPMDVTITRMAVTTEKEAEKQSGDNRTMGRKAIVPYGLYRAEGYVSACLADKTGFSDTDLDLLWNALVNMFDHDHSAARGKMNARNLIIFKHDSKLGNAPAHKLFDLVQVERSKESEGPARSYSDYQVTINRDAIPSGVELEERL